MEGVLSRGKEFEFLVIKHDPIFEDLVGSIILVKQFIKDRGLIIYGGSAIDYALRLRGDCIYPDDVLAVPDLDFYSPNSVEDSYDLADILFDAGFTEARAIVGMHSDTMRVDFADNHFIADIHYIPREIFDKIPTLVYEGMKIVHPSFQRVDLHSSLAFPYDNPPQEVIFARWSKDVKRFNKLDAAYPITYGKVLPTQRITMRGLKPFVLTGFAGYAAIRRWFIDAGYEAGDDICAAEFKIAMRDSTPEFTFDCLGRAEIMHLDPDECARKLQARDIKRFEAYAGILPRRIECQAGAPVDIYSSASRLASINGIVIDGVPLRVINVQGLLRHFAAVANLNPGTRLADTCWGRYVSLLKMIDAVCVDGDDEINTSPLMLSTTTYGSKNINHATEKLLSYVYRELDGTPVQAAPRNYKPANSRVRTAFDYEKNHIFADRGRELSGHHQ